MHFQHSRKYKEAHCTALQSKSIFLSQVKYHISICSIFIREAYLTSLKDIIGSFFYFLSTNSTNPGLAATAPGSDYQPTVDS